MNGDFEIKVIVFAMLLLATLLFGGRSSTTTASRLPLRSKTGARSSSIPPWIGEVEFEFDILSFRYTASLAETVRGENVSSSRLPDHLLITFSDRTLERVSNQHSVEDAGGKIYIFSTANWYPVSVRLYEPGVRINQQRLLPAHPAAPETAFFTIPISPQDQLVRSQVKYLNFQGGSGERFITHADVGTSAITDQESFYCFQGLTQDGAYYIEASFPITASYLSEEPGQDIMEIFSVQYQNYLDTNLEHLNTGEPQEFAPDLDLLDALIQSMVVDAYRIQDSQPIPAIPYQLPWDPFEFSCVAVRDQINGGQPVERVNTLACY